MSPEWLKPGSLHYLARIADLRGQREQALKLYKRGKMPARCRRYSRVSPDARAPLTTSFSGTFPF